MKSRAARAGATDAALDRSRKASIGRLALVAPPRVFRPLLRLGGAVVRIPNIVQIVNAAKLALGPGGMEPARFALLVVEAADLNQAHKGRWCDVILWFRAVADQLDTLAPREGPR